MKEIKCMLSIIITFFQELGWYKTDNTPRPGTTGHRLQQSEQMSHDEDGIVSGTVTRGKLWVRSFRQPVY
jgi:hypothetical protein